jgi:hypothetical protein
LPTLFVQIDGEEEAGLVEEHWVDAGDERVSLGVFPGKVPADDFVGDGEEALVWALAAFDPGFLANAADPFVAAGGLVSGPACFPAFEAAGIYIFASAEEGTEQFDFCFWRRVLRDGVYRADR